MRIPDMAIPIAPGWWGLAIMPYSEVCVHMRVAGRPMLFYFLANRMVQLFTPDGRVFSSPITSGEAGIYQVEGQYYYYPLINAVATPLPVDETYVSDEERDMLGYVLGLETLRHEKVPPGEFDPRD